MLNILERGLIGDKIVEQEDDIIGDSCAGALLLGLFIQFIGLI